MPQDNVLPSSQSLFQLLEVIAGASVPNVLAMTTYPLELAASTYNQQIIPTPGTGKQTWILGLLALAASNAGTVRFKDSNGTYYSGPVAVSYQGGFVLPMSGNFSMPWIKLATNTAFQADAVSCSIGGIITYAIVSV